MGQRELAGPMAQRPGRPSSSRNAVLQALKTSGELTVEELVRRTGISQPTVLKALAVLQQDGLIERSGQGESTGGRPPALYRYNPRAGTVLGLEVELPVVRAVLTDLAGNVLAARHWTLDLGLEAPRLLEEWLAGVQAFVTGQVAGRAPLQACGLAVTGFIDQGRGVWLSTPRVPTLRDWPVERHLHTALGVPVHLLHQIDALTLAEAGRQPGQSEQPFLYFDVAQGIGLRLMRAGVPLTGMFGNAGLIGHTTVVPDGLPCVCGNRGCLEMYASARAFRRLLDELRDLHPGAALNHLGRPAELADALHLAGSGDPHARGLVEHLVRFLGIGVANAVNVFEVTNVVLGGFVSGGGEEFRRQLLHEARARLQPILGRELHLVLSTADRDTAAPLGAARHALHHAAPPTPAQHARQPREETR